MAADGTLGCLAIGERSSLPVFLWPIAQDTGWSTTGISTAMTFAFVALALGSLGWGALSGRVGPRPVVLAGALLRAAGLALASLAIMLAMFQLCLGVVVGIGAAAIFAPMMACVTGQARSTTHLSAPELPWSCRSPTPVSAKQPKSNER